TVVQAVVAILLATAPVRALEAPRSGNPVFDRAVQLVMQNFHDVAALGPFVAAVGRQVDAPHSALDAASPPTRIDAGINAVLASLGASHTGRFKPDGIAYFELADIFRGAIRNDLKRLFPHDGEVGYEGIGMIAERRNGTLFVT